MSDWIKIEDGLPDPDVPVLCLLSDGVRRVYYLYTEEKKRYFHPEEDRPIWRECSTDQFRWERLDVTHWQELPDLPAD